MDFPKFEDFNPYKDCSLRTAEGICQPLGRPCQEVVGDGPCDAVMFARDDGWIRGYLAARAQENRC